MQKTTQIMERTVGAAEAEEGYLLVEKAWLTKLPDPDVPFTLTIGTSTLKTRIEETGPCDCRKTPHTHYRIPLPLMSPEQGKTARLRAFRGKVVLEYS